MSLKRRRETRYPFQMTATFSIGRRSISGKTLQISKNGIYASLTPVPPVNTFLRIRIDLPGDLAPLDFNGKVIHAQEQDEGPGREIGAGIELSTNNPKVWTAWQAFFKEVVLRDDVSVHDSVDDNITVSQFNAQELLKIYTLDVPRGFFFVATQQYTNINDVLLIDLKSQRDATDPAGFQLKGRVFEQHQEEGRRGLQFKFIDLDPATLNNFWQFICNQTPDKHPPMDFPRT